MSVANEQELLEQMDRELDAAHFSISLISGSLFMSLLSFVFPVFFSCICDLRCLSRFLVPL